MMSAVEIIAVLYQMNEDDVWIAATQKNALIVELVKSVRHDVQRNNNIIFFLFFTFPPFFLHKFYFLLM